MPLRPDMEIQDYIQIFSKRKWIIIFSFLFVFFGAIVHTALKPKLYKSSTTILIIPQRVPENFVRSTVTLGTEGRLATIQQQITSRTRLKKVMEELGLYTEMRKEGFEEEAALAMGKRIEIEVAQDPRSRRGGSGTESEAFSLSFLHKDPMVAMLTASRLASLFIDENLKLREKQAVGTSEFFDSQLREAKAKLDVQEEKVRRYKMQYLGELPQELQTNLNRLGRLQGEERMVADGIRVAEQRKLSLQSPPGAAQDPTQTLRGELNARRNLIAALSAKYTDQYPDVIRLREEVEELERKLAETPSPYSSEVESIEAEIEALKRERVFIRRNIAFLQAKVDQAPRRDQEMVSLTRDYDNQKKSYDDLLTKKTGADISQELEMRQKGDQYQILDPANLPKEPFEPKLKKIFGLAFLMATALGFGGAIGFETMDLSLRGVTDFKHFFDIPILASIPILETMEMSRRQKLRRKAIIGGIISFAFALFAFLLFFTLK